MNKWQTFLREMTSASAQVALEEELQTLKDKLWRRRELHSIWLMEDQRPAVSATSDGLAVGHSVYPPAPPSASRRTAHDLEFSSKPLGNRREGGEGIPSPRIGLSGQT